MSGNAFRHTLAVLTIFAFTSFHAVWGQAAGSPDKAFRDHPDWTDENGALTTRGPAQDHSPQVYIDGNIAALWAPYTFHHGDKFSHCGHDAFQFIRNEGQWRITAISFTMRQASDCE